MTPEAEVRGLSEKRLAESLVRTRTSAFGVTYHRCVARARG